MYSRSIFFYWLVFLLAFGLLSRLERATTCAQESGDTKVTGSVSLPKKFKPRQIRIETSRLVLLEEFVPSPLPTPKEFSQWSQQQKSDWYSKWEKSKAGEEYQQKEEKRFQKLRKHESKLQEDLSFDFEKVKPGNYDLAGEMTIQHGDKQYAAEFVAKVQVAEVAELKLRDVVLHVYRILEVGESMPDLSVGDRELVDRNDLNGKATLVVFLSSSRKLSEKLSNELVELGKKKSIRLVAIRVGPPADSGDTDPKVFWDEVGAVKSVDDKICTSWGVRGLPSFWLVDQKGKIAATPMEFAKHAFDFQQIVENR